MTEKSFGVMGQFHATNRFTATIIKAPDVREAADAFERTYPDLDIIEIKLLQEEPNFGQPN